MALTAQQLEEIKRTTTIGAAELAALYGCSPWAIYQNQSDLPVPAIHVGRKLRWPTAPVLRALGIETTGPEG